MEKETKVEPEWKTKYCKKFGLCRDGEKCQCKDELKYISNLLISQKKQLIKEIEGLKKSVKELFPNPTPPYEELSTQVIYKEGYNKALTDLQTLLKT